MTNSVPSSDLIKHFLLALGSDENEFCYGDETLSEVASSIKQDQTFIEGVEIEQVSRSAFYGGKGLLEVIKQVVNSYEPEDEEETIDLAQALNLDHAQPLFYASEPDEGGEYVLVLIGHRGENPAQNWVLHVSAFMGEYCDEDYDLSANVSFHTNVSKLDMDQQLQQATQDWVGRHVKQFSSALNAIKNSLPVSLQATFNESVLNTLQDVDLFRPVLANKENQELSSHVEEASQTSPSKRATKL